MNLISRLFAKPAAKAPEPVLHKDCRIFPAPLPEGSTFRIAARIEKDFGGETKVHQLIRADTRTSLEEAATASVDKARLAIDQLGDTIFR
jgi:hypothetical protein